MPSKPPQHSMRMTKKAEDLLRESTKLKADALAATSTEERASLMSKANKAYMDGIRAAKEYKLRLKTEGVARPGTLRRNVAELKGGRKSRRRRQLKRN
jgi:hypothetical protein